MPLHQTHVHTSPIYNMCIYLDHFFVVDTVNTTLYRKKEIQTTMPRSVAAFQLSSHVAEVQYWRGGLATQDFSSFNLTKASACRTSATVRT